MPGPVIIEPQNTGDAPLSYQLAAGQTLEVLAVAAEFDGTNAAGSFVPAVGFYAADGRRLARCPAPTTVTAGDSSEVSFFPFAPPASSGGGGGITEIESTDGSITVTNPIGPTVDLTGAGGGSGIQFGVTNSGSFLDVETNTGTILLQDFSGGTSEFTASGNLQLQAGNNVSIFAGAGKNIALSPQATVSGAFIVQWRSGISFVKVIETTSAGDLGFFGATPVAQQPTPITLADVIAVLQAYGLTA